MNRAVVSVGVDKHYPASVARLRESVSRFSPNIPCHDFIDRLPAGSPEHADAPYAFKGYALNDAISKGYKTLLWADASIVAVKPIEPLMERAEVDGVVLFHCGWSVGEWSTDQSLVALGITRDEARQMPLIAGTAFALCVDHPFGNSFFSAFMEFCESRHEVFRGPWTNAHGGVSGDDRVKGHRHDQVVLGYIAHKMGIAPTVDPIYWTYWPHSGDSVVISARGWGQP